MAQKKKNNKPFRTPQQIVKDIKAKNVREKFKAIQTATTKETRDLAVSAYVKAQQHRPFTKEYFDNIQTYIDEYMSEGEYIDEE